MDKPYFKGSDYDCFSWPAQCLMARLQPPYRCGILTHDNHEIGPHGAVRGSIQSYIKVRTPGGTAIIRGEKGESTYSGLKDQK